MILSGLHGRHHWYRKNKIHVSCLAYTSSGGTGVLSVTQQFVYLVLSLPQIFLFSNVLLGTTGIIVH